MQENYLIFINFNIVSLNLKLDDPHIWTDKHRYPNSII